MAVPAPRPPREALPGAALQQPYGPAGSVAAPSVRQPALPGLNEWLVEAADLAQAEQQRRQLAAYGLGIVSRQHLAGLGRYISVFRLPPSADLAEWAERLRQAFPEWRQEANQRYNPLSTAASPDALRQWGARAMGRASPAGESCGAGVRLALLDGPVDAALGEFSGAQLRFESLVPPRFASQAEADRRHASGIVALWLGRREVAGVIPGAEVVALGVLGVDAEAPLHGRTDWLLLALDRLALEQPPVQVVNLSLGGARSELLAQVFAELSSRMQFVAAAGNDGAAQLRYPAAYPEVLAVGAVDARLRRSRWSNYGRLLDLVAPGEDLWTVDERGAGYFASGTSFAAPLVSAALALSVSPQALQLQARDLGVAGRDDEYGSGLARLPGCR